MLGSFEEDKLDAAELGKRRTDSVRAGSSSRSIAEMLAPSLASKAGVKARVIRATPATFVRSD